MTRARFIAAALRNPNGCTAEDRKHIRRIFNKKKSDIGPNDILSAAYCPSMVGRLAYHGNAFLDMMPKPTMDIVPVYFADWSEGSADTKPRLVATHVSRDGGQTYETTLEETK